MSYQSFENLEVWKRACQLAVDIFELLKNSREFVYKDQMIRSSLSVPSNIAEGAERGGAKEFIRFLHIAKASSSELRTQLYISQKLELFDAEIVKKCIQETIELNSMMQGLINRLNK